MIPVYLGSIPSGRFIVSKLHTVWGFTIYYQIFSKKKIDVPLKYPKELNDRSHVSKNIIFMSFN